MLLLAIAYPKLDEEDFDWIQNYRKEHDPRYYSVVKPHFTLVFPVADMAKDEFVIEIKKQLTDSKAFDFVLRAATSNKDAFGEYYHEFLVPDEGNSDFIKLHDKLYSDKLAQFHRFDIDLIPHVGIGNDDSAKVVRKRVDKLNEKGVDIKGIIDSIDIVELMDDGVVTIEKIGLL